jgi:hypothetical protein
VLGLWQTAKRFRTPRFIPRVILDGPQEGPVRLPKAAVAGHHERLAAEPEDALLHGEALHLRLGGGEDREAVCAGGLLLFGG